MNITLYLLAINLQIKVTLFISPLLSNLGSSCTSSQSVRIPVSSANFVTSFLASSQIISRSIMRRLQLRIVILQTALIKQTMMT